MREREKKIRYTLIVAWGNVAAGVFIALLLVFRVGLVLRGVVHFFSVVIRVRAG